MPRSCSRRLRRTRPTPRSQICSSKPSALPTVQCCLQRVGSRLRKPQRSGWPTSSRCRARRSAISSGKPIARVFSGGDAACAHPDAEMDGAQLSNTVGSVLDPIISLRRRFRVRAGETVHAHLDARGIFSERGDRPRGQVPRRHDVRPHRHARQGAGRRPASPPRHRAGRSAAVPDARRVDPVFGSRAAVPAGVLARQMEGSRERSGRTGSLETFRSCWWRSTTPTDIGIVRAAFARARVLAHEVSGGRSRDPERPALPPTCRICRPCSRPSCTRASRCRAPTGGVAGEGVHPARRRVTRRSACVLKARRASPCSSRRGTLAEQSIAPQRPGCRPGPGRAPSRTAVTSRARGLRTRIPSSSSTTASAASTPTAASTVTILTRGPVHAGAVDQRDRQSRLRMPWSPNAGSGCTWSQQQPGEPAHRLVERSGERPAE